MDHHHHHDIVFISSATNRLIGAKDHASVQINIGDIDANGRYTGTFKTYALSGYVRAQSEADDSINRLATKDGCKFDSLSSCVFSYKQFFFFLISISDVYLSI